MATISYSFQTMKGTSPIPGGGNYPSVAALTGGGYVATSESGLAPFSTSGTIHPDDQSFSPQTFALGTNSSAQKTAQMSGLASGHAVAVFTDGTNNVRAVEVDAFGTIQSDHVLYPDIHAQLHPDVAGLTGAGGFVAAWEQTISPSDHDIYAQVVNADGTLRANFIIAQNGANETDPHVAALTNGGFAATWVEQVAAGTEIWVARYDASGNIQGSAHLVDHTGTVNHEPEITGLQNGGFAIAYTDNSWPPAGSSNDITLVTFDAAGNQNPSHIVNPFFPGGNQDIPAITTLSNGYIAVGWQNDNGFGSDTTDVAIFDQSGNFVYNEPGNTAHSSALTLAGLTGGGFAAAFYDESAFRADYKTVDVVRTTNGTNAPETLVGDGLTDVITGGDGGDSIFGGGGNDRLSGGAHQDFIYGEAGDDFISGGGGDDVLNGGTGLNYFEGGAGADVILGGSGGDIAVYINSAAGVTLNLLTGAAGIGGEAQGDGLVGVEGIYGSTFADNLTGDAGGNYLVGLEGDDFLDGGADVDAMAGGMGNDTYVVDNVGDYLGEFANEGTDTIKASIDYKLPDNFENLMLLPGAINGTGNELDNVITGNAAHNTLTGGLGNDTLKGAGGNDTLDGGLGDDTAIFSHNFNDYRVEDFGAKIMVAGPDGLDILTSIEHLKFDDVTITPADIANDGNPEFDTLYYLSRNSDVFHAGVNALDHFNNTGWHEGRDPNPFFDTAGYLAVNKDVAASGQNPLDQYHQSGWQQGRDPGANFDTKLYLLHNPDVAAAGIDPLAHYLANGFAEGRQTYKAIGTAVNGFDAEWYLLHNPDVVAAGVDPLAHFNANGWHEGRNPNAYFDTAGYLAHYADVAASGMNPLAHYEQFGWLEGRDPSAGFDTLGYLAQNPDVAAAHINPLDHFINNGTYEGRSVVNDGLWH